MYRKTISENQTQDLFPELSAEKSVSPTRNSLRTYKCVSLFSGCGGMDLGFAGGFKYCGKSYPKTPFEIVWSNDIDGAACQTYEDNLGHKPVCADIADIDLKSIPKVDVVIGGFPCQDFSHAGNRKGFSSKRGRLYQFMVDVVKRCDPQVFVAENVKGLLTIPGAIEIIKSDFEKAGYDVKHRLLNASDYGVPQNRERVIIVGVKGTNSFEWPQPDSKKITSKQAIGDLEGKKWGEVDGHVWSKAKRNDGSQGQSSIKADQPSITIRAEHHGNIEYHYSLKRRLSVREAARLQSFPDSFELTSSASSSYRQIGNAVPPVLAWTITNSLLEVMQ